MATKIEWGDKWWDKSITLVEGCTPVSESCEHCWSAGITHRFHQNKGLTTNGYYNGKITCREDRLGEILKRKKPTRWVIWNDLFHPSVPFEFIDKVMAVVALCPQHMFQILTKRPERMKEYFNTRKPDLNSYNVLVEEEYLRKVKSNGHRVVFPYKNLWLGVTAENQRCADERIPILLQIPAAVRFVSCEPLLGEIDLTMLDMKRTWPYKAETEKYNALLGVGSSKRLSNPDGCKFIDTNKGNLDWVIVGGESGPKRRECNNKWVRSIVEQCKAANVPVFVKQLSINGKVSKDMSEWPEDLQLREYPK